MRHAPAVTERGRDSKRRFFMPAAHPNLLEAPVRHLGYPVDLLIVQRIHHRIEVCRRSRPL
jgi:hypothetical protein